MKDSHNDNASRFCTKIDAVWKPLSGNTAYTIMNHAIKFGLRGSQSNTSLYFSDKIGSEVKGVAPRAKLLSQ